MNLLPKTNQEFSRAEYWDTFFKKRGQKSFEWYGEYPELCGYLHKYTKPQDNVLVLGCGNSTLSADLYNVGYRKIISVDISNVVIKQMQSLHSQERPELKFMQMDALEMSFEANKFSVVIDKGTLDALMPEDTEEVKERIKKMFGEINRVLRQCGRYIIISLLQEHILQAIIDFFSPLGWLIRITRCPEAEKREGATSGLAVFVIVCTKVKLQGSDPIVKKRLTSKRGRDTINLLWKDGKSVAEIAKLLNVSRRHVQRELDKFKPVPAKHGKPQKTSERVDRIITRQMSRKRRVKKHHTNEKERENMFAMWKDGKSMNEIARILDVSRKRVQMAIAKSKPVPEEAESPPKTSEQEDTLDTKEVLEFSTSASAPVKRLKDSATLIETIKEAQNAALVCSRVSSAGVGNHLGPITLDLYKPDGGSIPKYSVHIADKNGTRNSAWSYAVMVVPQGRETEWMFGTMEGREFLRKSVKVDRLGVVTLHRGQEYADLETIKDELSDCALQLAPKGHTGKIQFLSLGNDTGERKERFRSTSEISGEFVVEDVLGENSQLFRRLIFLDNIYVVQSEARLKKTKRKGETVDVDYLACEHHQFMTVGVTYALNSIPINGEILVIGLGGGALCTYIFNLFPEAKITAVDLDPQMETIATTWFGLPKDERINCVCMDGTDYIKEAARQGHLYTAVLFDVDSKDATQGMSCPPRSFLERDVLEAVNMLIGDTGMFILNLVCRSQTLRAEMLLTVSQIFPSVVSYKIIDFVNEVLYCRTSPMPQKTVKQFFRAAGDKYNQIMKARNTKDGSIDAGKFVYALNVIK